MSVSPADRQPGAILSKLCLGVASDAVLTDVRIGPFVTAVRTTVGTGIATTMLDPQIRGRHPMAVMAGRYQRMPVVEVVQRSRQGSTLERSVAVASIHGSIRNRLPVARSVNGFDILVQLGHHKRVVFIGHFPFVDSDRVEGFASLDVFELPERARPGDHLAEDLPKLLGRADLVAITGTTLVNNTLEEILSHCSGGSLRLMLGLTTPLSPILFECGLDILCGVMVEQPDRLLIEAAEGATHKQIGGLRKVMCVRPGLDVAG
ncbi:MAG: hypothetical protein JW797_02170 [Bradymonadales bacterium]|nr:hypothetical protein [Bradymonadales bacterium]